MAGDRLRRLKLAAVLLTAVAGIGVGWFYWSFPETIIRYKLSAEFRVDGNLVKGAGVWQVRYRPSLCFDTCKIAAKLSGEAIPIDLGTGRGTLWILLRQRNDSPGFPFNTETSPNWLVPYLFGHSPFSPPSFSAYVRGLRDIKGTVYPTLNQLPQMVILKSDELPIVYQWVGTGPAGSDLGSHPEFVGATITITDDPPTSGIRSRLKWLSRDQRPILALSERIGLTVANFEENHQ